MADLQTYLGHGVDLANVMQYAPKSFVRQRLPTDNYMCTACHREWAQKFLSLCKLCQNLGAVTFRNTPEEINAVKSLKCSAGGNCPQGNLPFWDISYVRWPPLQHPQQDPEYFCKECCRHGLNDLQILRRAFFFYYLVIVSSISGMLKLQSIIHFTSNVTRLPVLEHSLALMRSALHY